MSHYTGNLLLKRKQFILFTVDYTEMHLLASTISVINKKNVKSGIVFFTHQGHRIWCQYCKTGEIQILRVHLKSKKSISIKCFPFFVSLRNTLSVSLLMQSVLIV